MSQKMTKDEFIFKLSQNIGSIIKILDDVKNQECYSNDIKEFSQTLLEAIGYHFKKDIIDFGKERFFVLNDDIANKLGKEVKDNESDKTFH